MIIVFNLETIGFFDNFIILLHCIKKYFGIQFNFNQTVFNQLLDLYPELLLHNLLKIFNYIYFQKTIGNVQSCFFTSSKNYSAQFIQYLINYLNYKLQNTLFTIYIPYNDFYNTYLKRDYYESVLYISNEDNFMRHYNGNIQYIILDKYIYYISILNMLDRIQKCSFIELLNEPYFVFETKMEREMNKYDYVYSKNSEIVIYKNNQVVDKLLNIIRKHINLK